MFTCNYLLITIAKCIKGQLNECLISKFLILKRSLVWSMDDNSLWIRISHAWTTTIHGQLLPINIFCTWVTLTMDIRQYLVYCISVSCLCKKFFKLLEILSLPYEHYMFQYVQYMHSRHNRTFTKLLTGPNFI